MRVISQNMHKATNQYRNMLSKVRWFISIKNAKVATIRPYLVPCCQRTIVPRIATYLSTTKRPCKYKTASGGHTFLDSLKSHVPWLSPLHKCVIRTRYLSQAQWPPLQWRHNENDGVSNHQLHDCLLSRFFICYIKENTKAPRHWPLWGEFTGHRWIPRTKDQ